jgi:hypothetical protein
MNRSLVFDLVTAAFIAKREDALFLGPGGSGKSHLAQAIGQAAIQQGCRVVYRETHVLLDDLAVSAGLKQTQFRRFCSQSKKCHRRGRGMDSKIVSKFCLASGQMSRYDSASAKLPCTLWTEPACFAGPTISTVAANATAGCTIP